MKRFLLLLITSILTVSITNAQSPDMFNYQAVAHDDQGNVLSNQNVGIKISILQGSANGNVVYAEEHNMNTNEQGLISLMVGNGTVISGTFSDIDWKSGSYFLEVGLDAAGGTSYTTMGTTQLVSVPYAKYADSSGTSFSGDYADLNNTPDFTDWDQDVTDDFSGDYADLTNTPDLSDTASYDDYWMNMTDTIFYDKGMVGIGTDSVTHKLTLSGTGSAEQFTIRDEYPFIELNAMNNTNPGYRLMSDNNVKGALWYNANNDNVILQRDALVSNDITLDQNSNVGINTSTPQEKLHVNGGVRVDGTSSSPSPNTIYANMIPLAYGDINDGGSLLSSYGIASVNKVATGSYEVELKNGYNSLPGISVTPLKSSNTQVSARYYTDENSPKIVEIFLYDGSGNLIDNSFNLVVLGRTATSKTKSTNSKSESDHPRVR